MDAPRLGAARRIDDDVGKAVVVDTLETAPADATCWLTRDLAVDEKPQIQALDRTAPIRPMLPTTPKRGAAHGYQRNGTRDLCPDLNVARGTVTTHIREGHAPDELIRFLQEINREVPHHLDVHLTPSYSSWLNLAERWFSALTTKKLQRSSHRRVTGLARDIRACVDQWNTNLTPSSGTKPPTKLLSPSPATATKSPHTTNNTPLQPDRTLAVHPDGRQKR